MANKQNFYTNPAFCQKSELPQHPPRALSPRGDIRQSPLGAQTVYHHKDSQNPDVEAGLQEQEFYEEVVVDDKGFITDKKFVVVAQNNEGKKYIQVPQSEASQGSRYGLPQPVKAKETKLVRSQSQRYEYIQMQEQDVTPRKKQYREETAVAPPARIHRYAVIETEEETELTTKNARYALVPVEQLPGVVTKNRYEYIPDQQRSLSPPGAVPRRNDYIQDQQRPLSPNGSVTRSPNRYEYIQDPPRPCPPQSPTRYEYIQDFPRPAVAQSPQRYDYIQRPLSPQSQGRYDYIQERPPGQSPARGNPAATQKLHELLSTPKKTLAGQKHLLSPLPGRRITPPPVSPILKEFQAKPPQRIRTQPSRAQQKLNYAIGAQHLGQQDKRHTAIVAPICSNLNQSVYSETTYSKSGSSSNLSMKRGAVQNTLSFAAVMMLLSGGVTSGLCFYMISVLGRQYFLDFGVVAGFTCLVLGLLGFRSRNVYWLPNRNYISGYLVLSFFSLLTCTGLLFLLVKQPRSGTPLADMTSGAVCGVSVLCLLMATTGVVSSYCCKYPPPDNRVQHCAEGFSV
ncbi:sanpodo [Leptinotarsa decemlineata]|uniref:sanpodo n=1 Tax=Leptinotarsa decemlineata TaxID=7539 RepID=UPI003D306CDD